MSNAKQPIYVYGGINNIVPSATKTDQVFNAPAGHQTATNAVGFEPVGGQSSPVIHHYFTHEAIGVSRLLRQAKKYIVLHAAFYPKYAGGEQGDDIRKVMEENLDLRLKVIFTDLNTPWINEFAVLLREKFADIKKFEKEINDDKEKFVELQMSLKKGRDRVEISDSARLPLFPVILIDDTLIVGHYAHSREIAPNGLWLTIQHPRILEMYESLSKGNRPECNTPEERAILRYVEELVLPNKTPIRFGSSQNAK